MIHSLCGNLLLKGMDNAVIQCGGVGFDCKTTQNTLAALPAAGEEAMLFCYLHVKDDGMDLYGFSSKEELDCFKMLITVSGVGPRNGLSILSTLTPDRVLLCIASGDTKTLVGCPGVGAKLASRMVLELKDKIKGIQINGTAAMQETPNFSGGSVGDAMQALVALGYSQSEAARGMAGLDAELPAEELIKGALKALAGGK